MKKISALIMVVILSGFLVGCYSTACNQPQPMPMSVKGEG